MFIYTLLNPRLESLLHFEVWYLQHHGNNDFDIHWMKLVCLFFSPTYRQDQVWVSLHLSSWLWFDVGFYVCVTGHDPIFGHDNFHICISLKTPPTCSRSFFKDKGPTEKISTRQNQSPASPQEGICEVIQVWSSGKQTLKSFIRTPAFLVGNNYSANLPLAKLISVLLVRTSLISS